jgi:hypothetical protein
MPLTEVLALLRIPKDFESSRALDASVPWIHRRAGDVDIYFLANRGDRALEVEARFRVSGKAPELWHPDTGAIEPAAYSVSGNRTTVPLQLSERESVFVVFRAAAASPSRTVRRPSSTLVATVGGPWDVSFPPDLGAPAKIQLAKLESWTANSDEGVKFFSGTATYVKTMQAPQTWFRSGEKLLLDLGAVRDLAEVSVNGKPLGIVWKPPYQVDVSGVLRPGSNRLEIKITNQWTNRQIGDRLVAPEKRVFAQPPGRGGFGRAPQAPPESGLLGPVTILSMRVPQ